MSTKRKTAPKSSRKPAAPKKQRVATHYEEAFLPLKKWRIVLTGDFKSKGSLERALKEKGVAIAGSLSGKTTHLLLGKSGTNEYGKPTGVGSKKHSEAKQRGLPIISEDQAYALILGHATPEGLAAAGDKKTPKKPTKGSKMLDKALYIFEVLGHMQKASLAKLKTELSVEFGLNFTKAQTKNSLKKALGALVSEGKLVKDGASYKKPGGDGVGADIVAQVEANHREGVQEDKIKKLAPELGRWRGLRVLASGPSKSGRAKCGGCGRLIAKGETQTTVSDDSLFKMLVFPGDHHEGVSRGYVECGYPGYDVVSRKKFFVHAGCVDDATEQYEDKFQSDWSRIRCHVVADLRGGL